MLASQLNLSLGGFTGVIFNAIVAFIALVSILILVPKTIKFISDLRLGKIVLFLKGKRSIDGELSDE